MILAIKKTPFRSKILFWHVVFILLLITFAIADIFLGSVLINPGEVIKSLLQDPEIDSATRSIVTQIRLPKALTAIFAGAALSISGLLLQTLFRNPLAGPSVLGITSGAGLGVAAILLSSGLNTSVIAIRQLGIGESYIMFGAASAGSLFVLLVIMAVASRVRDNVILLIIGIMVGNLTISIVSIWQYFSRPEEIQSFIFWTFGSLGAVDLDHLLLMIVPVVLLLIISFLFSHRLNIFLLGEDGAKSLGINTKTVRWIIIIISSMLTGIITGLCGPIGFIGIAVPHLARAIFNTDNHKYLIPACILIGAILLLFSDIVSRLPGSQFILPINAITALIGSPVVIWVILKRKSFNRSF